MNIILKNNSVVYTCTSYREAVTMERVFKFQDVLDNRGTYHYEIKVLI